MKTCATCSYFEPVKGHPGTGDNAVGNCLVDPPRAFPTVMPPSVLQQAPQMQPAIQGLDPPTRAGRRGCRHHTGG